jgi:hypothetical protein
MPRPTAFPIKKLIGFDADLWGKVREYRFSEKLNTESDAVRRLIELGLSASGGSGTPSSGAGGKGKTDTPPKPSSRAKTNPTQSAAPEQPSSKEAQLRALRESRA